MEIRKNSINLSQSKISDFKIFNFCKLCTLFHAKNDSSSLVNWYQCHQYHYCVIVQTKRHENDWMNRIESQKIALKLIYLWTTPQYFCLKTSLTSWPSGVSHQTILDRLVKSWGGAGGQKFFLIFSKIDLRPNLIFTLFFKPYVTFLCIFMANFLKMAPLFTFEPTVSPPVADF